MSRYLGPNLVFQSLTSKHLRIRKKGNQVSADEQQELDSASASVAVVQKILDKARKEQREHKVGSSLGLTFHSGGKFDHFFEK